MPTKLTATSLKRLDGVHPHLVAVLKRAAEITLQPFQVTEGVRTLSRQRQLFRKGASLTMNSRHLKAPNGLGHAVDVVAVDGGRISWSPALYHVIADAFRRAAQELGIKIKWGGTFKGLFDGPHFELDWQEYPGIEKVTDAPLPRPTVKELATLVPGSHGQAVVALQNDLTRLGFTLSHDGQFGPLTRAAFSAALGKLGVKPTDVATAALQERIAKAARAAERANWRAA